MYRESFDGTLRANTLLCRIATEESVGESLSPDTIGLYLRKIRQVAIRASVNNYQQLAPEIVVRDLQERIDSKKNHTGDCTPRESCGPILFDRSRKDGHGLWFL